MSQKGTVHFTKTGANLAACGWSGIGIEISTDEEKVTCKKCILHLNNFRTKETQLRLRNYR